MTASRRNAWALGLLAFAGLVSLGSPAGASSPEPLVPAVAPSAQTAAAPAAQPAASAAFATLEAAGGQVSVIRLGREVPLSSSMSLERNDIVVTKRGRATVRFESDGTVVRVGPDSRVQINESATERDVTVFFGRLWAHVVRWKERTTRFATGSTIAAIRGTEVSLGVASDGNETKLAVLEGHVEAQTDAGTLALAAGESSVSAKGRKPAAGVRVRPQDAVQWALYYLPVLYTAPGELGQGQEWQAKAQEAAEAYLKGDLAAAVDSVEGVAAEGIQDARFFTFRASLRLATGNVEEAEKDIEQALKLKPNDGDALALKAIVAVARNENDAALTTAHQAVTADPKSATAQIALSYALQARFDLEGARQSLEEAVKLDPKDALAWARLAEIRSSLGERDAALEAAQKAVQLQPNLSRTQTVLGFAYLTRVQTRQGAEAFRKAIQLDANDPLPRLGLGLAEIRDGHLSEGSKEIEVAVSLDPAQSIVRSYLGKAYFEGKRTELDQREYDVAEQSDPKDPTPWFYDAITKQTTNRPVEALESLEKAIELNDNRGVYRSRLLLDSDLAARSASLGRIYNDLGFQDLGLVEGWNSLNTDPSNYSAHRLLADNYAAIPRHQIARVSELFQSQMLQPLNTTPIQPSLGESNLFLIASEGPSTLSFHEFNPLFNRNQVNVQGGFLAAEDSTWAGDGIVSGIYDKFSFSGGYSGYKTDGFRENNNQDDKIANAFAQVELNPSTSIQAEVRHRKLEAGDLSLNILPDDFNPDQSQEEDRTNVRVGLRHDFAPGATVLASYMHSDQDTKFAAPVTDLGLDVNVNRNEKADSVEGQFLFRSSSLRVVGGAGYFDIGSAETLTTTISDIGLTDITATDKTIKHTNLYAYSYIPLPGRLTLTLGASGDRFDEKGDSSQETQFPGLPSAPAETVPALVLGEQNQFNPKAGVVWNAKTGTTFRAAWFKTLKRTLITDQTLEPTQVAGFNQFFDEAPATKSRVYGGAIDQKFGRKVFGGIEYSRRELTIPFTNIEFSPEAETTVTVDYTDADERLGRAYLFFAPHPWVTFGAEYQYEKFRRDPEQFFIYSTLKTQRLPLSVRFFHPSGISAFVGATYLDQEGNFATISESGESEFVPRESKFWVVDAALRYRLPKRYGFLVAGVNNLTDERSTYQATDPTNLRIRPGRVIYGRLVVAFP
jgi:Tfp pilus assembly protein PilF